MNQPPSPESRWEKLVAQARADAGPGADVPALLRAVRQAEPRRDAGGWAADFAALFATRRILSGCLAGACAFAILAGWQAWETWQVLPWAEWIDMTNGGVL